MTNTKIEWADKVWNPVTGCSPVSEGCRNCYARRMAQRLRGRCGYPKDEPFRDTLHPERLAEVSPRQKPSRVFVCSMGDLFQETISVAFIAAVFGMMAWADQHTYFILTKRPQNAMKWFENLKKYNLVATYDPVLACAQEITRYGGPVKAYMEAREKKEWPLPNVWLGVSVEDQKTANERIPLLLQTPAAKRFVSIEPMLGPVDFMKIPRPERFKSSPYGWHNWLPQELHWVIVGGETGPNARPMHPDWTRSVRDQCIAAGVPFFFKGWGEWSDVYGGTPENAYDRIVPNGRGGGWKMWKVGKKNAGALLDGVEYREVPR